MLGLFRIARLLVSAGVRSYRWPHWGLVLILAAVTAAYWPTLHDAFHGDDFVAFTEFKMRSFWEYTQDVFLFKDVNFYWRPLGKIAHYLLYEAFGLDPYPFRLFNLGLFLATLILLYALCLREGLGRGVALGAVLLLGLLPNHVVSVTWVTNQSRLMAVFFVVAGMVLLQTPGTRRRFYHEIGAFLLVVAGVLSDETALALVPVPLLYATFVNHGPAPRLQLSREHASHLVPAVLRFAFYGALIAVIAPLQIEYGITEEPRLMFYGFGPHVLTQTWVLASQLVMPLTPANPFDILQRDIPTVQWTAGAVAIAGGAIALVLGSRWLKLLVIWCGLGLAPFTLWDLSYTSPRYVYMAAVPFAIILSWGVGSLVPELLRLARPLPVRGMAAGVMTGVLAVGVFLSFGAVRERDSVWTAQTEKYRPLAEGLQAAVKEPKPGSRLVIYYGNWPDFWSSAVVQTIYGDRSLRVVSVPGKQMDTTVPRLRPNDIVLYYFEDRFVQMGLASTSGSTAASTPAPAAPAASIVPAAAVAPSAPASPAPVQSPAAASPPVAAAPAPAPASPRR